MNKTLGQGLLLVEDIIASSSSQKTNILTIIAPPYIHLAAIYEKVKSIDNFAVAAQNCHHLSSGAYTGEVSAEMITSTGATHVIIGHSERRLYNSENNLLLVQKVNIALQNKLTPIFCIGESIEERNANKHLEAIKIQLKETLFHLSASVFGI